MKPAVTGKHSDRLSRAVDKSDEVAALGGKSLPKPGKVKVIRARVNKEETILEVDPAAKQSRRNPAADLTTPYADAMMSFAHEMAVDLFEGGLIDQTTMREIDDLALTPVKELGPAEIKRLREAAGLSQSVLARVLNVTSSSVSQWERGEKNPSGSALKLLSLARAKGMRAIM